MVKTHLIGIKKICKNSVWHHNYHQQHYQQQREGYHQEATVRRTIFQAHQRIILGIWKNGCCRCCLRKRRKFHDLINIQNLWFGSNQKVITNCNNNRNI